MSIDDDNERLTKPIAINMLIHFRTHPEKEFGTREIQRILKIKSSSTASSYLKQLAEIGLIQKSTTSLFIITEKGKTYEAISFPILEQIKYFKGVFLPKYSFLLSYMFFSFIITGILLLLQMHLGVVVMNSLLSLFISFIAILREWFDSKWRFQQFLDIL